MRRLAPRPVGWPVGRLADRLAPTTRLAALQRAWPGLVGEVVADEARPIAERDGEVVVACRSAVWAHELELLGPTLVERLNAGLAEPWVSRLRCRATRTRDEP